MNEDLGRHHEDLADETLVDEFRAGREWAYNELVRRYSGKVLTLCTGFLRDREQAYDASQEVFLKIYRALPGFRGASKLSTWIHTIAINTCKNRVSFWRRLLAGRRGYDADPLVRRVHAAPDEDVLRSERARAVREAIGSLPVLHREIIVLKDLQGCSYEDIGRILGLTAGTVKSRLHRAREALSKLLVGLVDPE